MSERAMLLEKVDSYYERVGIFLPRDYWSWDEKGKLRNISGLDGEGRDALGSTRKRFWLG